MKRLEKFTPIHPKKAAFYKSLLTFYKSVKETVPVENFTDKQMAYRLPLENFNVNGGYIFLRVTLTKYRFLIRIW